jgi:hypothetical protein
VGEASENRELKRKRDAKKQKTSDVDRGALTDDNEMDLTLEESNISSHSSSFDELDISSKDWLDKKAKSLVGSQVPGAQVGVVYTSLRDWSSRNSPWLAA